MRPTDPSAAQSAVEHLRRLAEENGGKVPAAVVRATAERLGRTERTIWGWLRSGPPGARPKQVLGETQQAAIAAENGNLKRAWMELAHAGAYQNGYRQFVRDVQALAPVVRAGLTGGVKEALKHGLYLKGSSTGRLDRVIFDHTEADIRLRREHAGSVEMFRPWVTLLIDSHTRVILGCTVTEGDGIGGDPNTESLVALLAGAIRGSAAADGTFVGGLPRLVQFDNAKAHLADAMLNGYLELGIATHAIQPGSPWQDGRVERLMLTLKDEFLSGLPGFTAALTDRYNHPAWTPGDCLTMDEFMVRLEQWIDHYNYERNHSSLGCTPFEAWRDDPVPIERIDDGLIRHGFLAVRTGRKISKNGVRFRDVDYVHVALSRLVGKKVAVRFLPNDRSFIDVYLDDAFVCTAVPHARMSKDERLQIIRERERDVRAVNRVIKRSRKRAVERELAGNPLLSPARDPSLPDRSVDGTGDDEFLAFLESSNSEHQNGTASGHVD
jgi:transposase InsO family protein